MRHTHMDPIIAVLDAVSTRLCVCELGGIILTSLPSHCCRSLHGSDSWAAKAIPGISPQTYV